MYLYSQPEKNVGEAQSGDYTLTCSGFAEKFFQLGGKPFSVEGNFAYLREPMDDISRTQLFIFGRQTGKSTIMSGKTLGILSMMPNTGALHVSPTEMNRKQYERDRLKAFMKSPKWKEEFYGNIGADNTEYKQLNNDSYMYLRNVFENADRARGLTAGVISVDELQDILKENLDVVFESQSVPEFKLTMMAGTQSHLESSVNYYWDVSDQKEFIVECSHCNLWNEIDEKNIGKMGLICRKCKKDMKTDRDRTAWISQNPTAHISAYRFPQICRPNLNWSDFYQKFLLGDQKWLYNEILALPYDNAGKPITRAEVMQACTGVEDFLTPVEVGGWRTFAGIDWGSGSPSSTQLVIAREGFDQKLEIIYAHKYLNYESDPMIQQDEICKRLTEYNVTMTFADWGFGFAQNKFCMGAIGYNKFQQIYFSGNQRELARFEPTKIRWTVSREQMLTNVFIAIKKLNIILPKWEVIAPFAQEILNVYTEYNQARRLTVYNHSPTKPDDFLFALSLSYMAFNFAIGRLSPIQESMQKQGSKD